MYTVHLAMQLNWELLQVVGGRTDGRTAINLAMSDLRVDINFINQFVTRIKHYVRTQTNIYIIHKSILVCEHFV